MRNPIAKTPNPGGGSLEGTRKAWRAREGPPPPRGQARTSKINLNCVPGSLRGAQVLVVLRDRPGPQDRSEAAKMPPRSPKEAPKV